MGSFSSISDYDAINASVDLGQWLGTWGGRYNNVCVEVSRDLKGLSNKANQLLSKHGAILVNVTNFTDYCFIGNNQVLRVFYK